MIHCCKGCLTASMNAIGEREVSLKNVSLRNVFEECVFGPLCVHCRLPEYKWEGKKD